MKVCSALQPVAELPQNLLAAAPRPDVHVDVSPTDRVATLGS